MITVEALCGEVPGLTRDVLEHFLAQGWVRAARREPEMQFAAMDAARVRLIVELRQELLVEDATLPVVLSLLDQLYATRRQLRLVLKEAPPEQRARLLQVLAETTR